MSGKEDDEERNLPFPNAVEDSLDGSDDDGKAVEVSKAMQKQARAQLRRRTQTNGNKIGDV